MTTLEPTPVADRPHPVVWFAQRAHQVLDEVLAGGVHCSELDAEVTAEAVLSLSRLTDRIDALRTSLLPHAEAVDVAAHAVPIATATSTWLAHATRTPGGQARRLVKTARRLETIYFRTLDAALDGIVDRSQCEVIVTAMDKLPTWVSAEQRIEAEEHLLDLARRHDAKQLALLARHLLHVIDPDAADAELAAQLEREEAHAARTTVLKLIDDGRGTCHGSFKIPTLHGAMLAAALDALTSPTRPDAIARQIPDPHDPGGPLLDRTAPELLGQAFVELIERYPTKKLPRTGGGLATVLVTIPLAVLTEGLGVATLSTGGQVSEGAARRLACTAGIIPAVLGTKSEPLDVGRRNRLHTETQRIAMTLRDKHCTAEGCTVPAARCHAHHNTPWSLGGSTSTREGRLLCPRHHTLIHKPGHHHTVLPDGAVRITKARIIRQ